jgi:prevent-host-death family protein
MDSIGVRELKQHTSRILRSVRERRQSIDVTYRGRIIARLIPVEPPLHDASELEVFLTDLDRLAAEVGSRWPAGVSAVDAVREQRRDV